MSAARLALAIVLLLTACSHESAVFVARDTGVSEDAADASRPVPAGWLYTSGNHIYRDGAIWMGRGVNFVDLHMCGRDATLADTSASLAFLEHEIDVLVSDWHATFLRIVMSADDGSNFANNPELAARMVALLEHVEAQPNLYAMLSVYGDPSFRSSAGVGCCPQETSLPAYEAMVRATGHLGHVMYGLTNEPNEVAGSPEEAALGVTFEHIVQRIRDTEATMGVPPHLVSVQATQQWSRYLDYFVAHPIAAGGGVNVVYEVHAYDFPEDYDRLFVEPSRTLPLVIGQLGPFVEGGRAQDYVDLMMRADALSIPYTAWIFDWNCGFALIADDALTPTAYGQEVHDHIAPLGP